MLKQMKYCTRATQKKRHVTLYVSIDNKQHRATAVTVAESEEDMKKYKVSGMRENGKRWEYKGKRTMEQVEEMKKIYVFEKYRLIDVETGEEIIINR